MRAEISTHEVNGSLYLNLFNLNVIFDDEDEELVDDDLLFMGNLPYALICVS